jgi:hypothetical protein
MTWNYRVVRALYEPVPGLPEATYSIVEVYYEKDGSISGWCKAGVSEWDSEDELRRTLSLMGEAFTRPLLELPTESSELREVAR